MTKGNLFPPPSVCVCVCPSRHNVLGDQKSVLTDQLASFRDQVHTLQSELAIYQKLLEEVQKTPASSASREAGTQAATEEDEGSGGVVEERVVQLLKEVGGLREQLDSSIQHNSTLAEELRAKLDRTFTDGGHAYSDYASKATSTKGVNTRDRGSGSSWDHTHHRSVHTTKTSGMATSGTQTKPGGKFAWELSLTNHSTVRMR